MTQVIIFSFAIAIENAVMFRIGYKFGIKTEQRARINRINTLKRLLNGKV